MRTVSGFTKAVLAVALVNLVLHGTWVLLWHPQQTSDFAFYLGSARRISAGDGYVMWMDHGGTGFTGHGAWWPSTGAGRPTAFWPVGWPLALAGLFWLGGPVGAAFVLQALLSTVIAVLTMVLAYRVTGSVRVGVVAGVVLTLLPHRWAYDSTLGSEQLFTALALGALVLLLAESPFRLAAGGALLGLACWVRPVLLLLPLVLGALWLVQRYGALESAKRAALVAVPMALVIAPLTIRNAVRLDAFVPVSTNGGVNLYQGVRADKGFWWPAGAADNPLERPGLTEVQRDRLGSRLAREHWRSHPVEWSRRVPARLGALYGPADGGFDWMTVHGSLSAGTRDRVVPVVGVAYWLMMAGALAGLVIGWRRHRSGVPPLLAVLGYYTAEWAFFPGDDRFRYPIEPLFVVFAAIAVCFLWRDRRVG